MSRRRGVGVTGAILAVALLTGLGLPEDAPLLEATERGDVERVRSLLEAGADPNGAQGDGMTALHLAARRGHVQIVEVLIEAGAKVDAKTRIGNYTPLHVASELGHARVVAALLEAGSDPKAVTTNSGVTALHLAAKAADGAAAVAALLEHGAPVNAREASTGQTPLMFAAAYGRAASVRELLKHGADPGISTKVVDVLRSMAIDRAANGTLREAMAEIRRNSAEGTARALRAAEVQEAIAAQREFLRSDEEIAKVLEEFDPDDLIDRHSLYEGGPEIDFRPYRETLVGKTGGMTALLLAAREGHIETVRALLDGGAEIDQVSGDGTSPLLMATLNGQFDLALVLIERGANPNLAAYTDGASPLFAVLQTHWSPKSNYPQPRAHQWQKSEYMDVLRALLEAGADPNVRLKTHLWYWEFGLTKMGIDLTGATPFFRAAFAQDLEAMKLLAAYGADPNIPTRWPAVGMRERRRQDGRQQEDSGLPPIPEGTPNMYPIHAAAGGGYMGLGAFMVNNVPDNFLNTVKYLVDEHGADVNLPDSWGYTPLHYASVRGGNDLIVYLLERGADVRAVSTLGQSTADMARGGFGGFFKRVEYPGTVDLLTSAGSPLLCLHTHFRDTGNFCPGAGVEPWPGAVIEGAESSDEQQPQGGAGVRRR